MNLHTERNSKKNVKVVALIIHRVFNIVAERTRKYSPSKYLHSRSRFLTSLKERGVVLCLFARVSLYSGKHRRAVGSYLKRQLSYVAHTTEIINPDNC